MHLSVSILSFKNCHYSITSIALIVSFLITSNHTPIKNPHITLPMHIKGKTEAIIARAILRSFCSLLVYSQLLPVEFPSID